MRRALDNFPFREMAENIKKRYFIPGGKAPDEPFKSSPVSSIKPGQHLMELTVVSNFVEVFLAKESHDGQVGINYLEKIQLPNLPSIYGAMLAGVNCIIMGAGIPRAIPGVLDKLARGEAVELPIAVAGAKDPFLARFDPSEFLGSPED